jgi:outer membrane receptor protein involved in Fe transport
VNSNLFASFGRKFATLVLAVAVVVVPVVAQTETGQISGRVVDPSGGVVPNAKVVLTAVATDAKRTSQTSTAGMYAFANVVPGEYTVSVEAQGFSTSMRRVTLPVGGRVAVDFKLEVGQTSTVVIVAEQAVQVNTETQTLGATITSKQVLNLPTLTRNPYALVAISGNVSEADPTGRGVGYAINGLRAAATNVLLDGAANNDEFSATVGQNVPLDAVQEFSVLTNNFTAEFGRASGGIVNATTKSGSNEVHGTGYWFNRVSKLGSNNFNNNANGVAKPVYTRNQPGYSVGGPVIKNKLFFFQSTEWIRIRSQAISTVYVPTPELIGAAPANVKDYFSAFGKLRTGMTQLGTFSKSQLADQGQNICAGASAGGPCNQLSATLPVFARYAYSYPSDSGGGTPQNTHFGVARVDYNPSEKTQMYGRYAWEFGDFLSGSISNSPWAGFDTGQTVRNHSGLFSLVRTISASTVSQSKVVFNRLGNVQPLGAYPPTPTLYLASGSVSTRLLGTRVAMPGYLPYSPGSGIPFGGPQNFIQLYEDLSHFKGHHQIRIGGSYTYIRDNRTFGAYQNPVQQVGANFGTGMDNFLRGVDRSFQSAIDPQGKYPCNGPVTPQCSVTLPVGQPSFSRSNRYHEWAAYAQDSWKVTPRFTLNLGVRYEYFGVQHNKNPFLDSNFYPVLGGTEFQQLRNGDVALAPNSYAKGLWKPDRNNFAPRMGFAWDIFGDGKTSFRGGYSVAYERNFGNVTFNVIQNPPNYAVISLIAGADVPSIPITKDLAGPLAGSTGTKGLPRVSLRAVNPEIRTAYANLWSFSLERQLSKDMLTSIEYSGSSGKDLYSLENPNRVGAGNVYLGIPCSSSPGDQGTCTARLLANQGYSNINMRNGKGFSHYHGLNVRFQMQNMARTGLSLTSNYTWSHAIDNLSSTFSESSNNYNLGLLDPFNPKLDRGDADFDIRHRWAVSAIWNVPFAKSLTGIPKHLLDGWQVAPILTLHSGAPYTIFDVFNSPNGIYPRMMLLGPSSKMGNAGNVPTATPNVNIYHDLTKLNIYTDYANPITGTGEFGPYPAMMTGRNVFRTPGTWNIDLGIYKNNKWTERLSTQLRFEFYNAVNHANLYVDTGNADDSLDYISSYRSGNRNVQLALKFIF